MALWTDDVSRSRCQPFRPGRRRWTDNDVAFTAKDHDTAMPSQRESAAAEAARHWRAALPRQWRTSSTLRGLLVVAIGATVYLGTFAGMFLLPAWWARLACLIVQPVAV